MLIASLTPLLGGLLLKYLKIKSRRTRTIYVEAITILTSLLVVRLLLGDIETVTLISYSRTFCLSFGLDGTGKVFLGLMAFLWPLAALYAAEYMEHEERENSFFSFYTMTYGVMILFCCSANLFTMYVLFECITLVTLPLVWHKKDSKSMRAARAYIRYSIGCAAFAFASMILLSIYSKGNFQPGGTINEMPRLLMNLAFLAAFFGFGVKAAVFPLCAWLPRASAAPTPVTALLHAVAVVNAGVFAVLRVIYHVFGAELLLGSWAQTIALSFSAATIIFGAWMAVRDTHVKRKLAYSTVSNLGYMLLGATLMTASGMLGSLVHMVCHGLMKILLFFCIGAVMIKTDRTQVYQMRGLARKMPLTFSFFTVGAIALMGIPPLCGFISKYHLINAAVAAGGTWAWLGTACLLLSSLLTAIYTLSMLLPAFFLPLEGGEALEKRCDPGLRMIIPFALICAAILLLGVNSKPLIQILRTIVA